MQNERLVFNGGGYVIVWSVLLMASAGCGYKPNSQFPVSQPGSTKSSDDELEVFSAAIEDEIRDDGSTRAFVVQAETTSPREVPTMVLDELEQQGYDAKTWTFDFVASPPRVIPAELTLSIPYRLVPDAYLTEVFDNGSWKRFNEEFPEAQSIVEVSRAHFYENGNRAVLCVRVISGPLDGHWGFTFLMKAEGQWHVENSITVGFS